MFSPHDSPAVNDWFRRLDAAWRRLPGEERASQRDEIHQHLEALVAAKVAQGQPSSASWEAALRQFGDPTQIGRKMYQEWQQAHSWLRSDLAAVLCVVSLCLVLRTLESFLPGMWSPSHHTSSVSLPVLFLASFLISVTIGLAIGLHYPFQALKATLYGMFLACMWSWTTGVVGVAQLPVIEIRQIPLLIVAAVLPLPWSIGLTGCIAYLASVTKRGWYKPSLADFKLTLPRKRPQTSR